MEITPQPTYTFNVPKVVPAQPIVEPVAKNNTSVLAVIVIIGGAFLGVLITI